MNTCDVCGLALTSGREHDLRALVDGSQSFAAKLCLECRDDALLALVSALRPHRSSSPTVWSASPIAAREDRGQ